MILHNVEIINHTLEKILKGEDGLNSRIHIGASYYLSVNSPYKTVCGERVEMGNIFPQSVA